jgi:hypothetical protein
VFVIDPHFEAGKHGRRQLAAYPDTDELPGEAGVQVDVIEALEACDNDETCLHLYAILAEGLKMATGMVLLNTAGWKACRVFVDAGEQAQDWLIERGLIRTGEGI